MHCDLLLSRSYWVYCHTCLIVSDIGRLGLSSPGGVRRHVLMHIFQRGGVYVNTQSLIEFDPAYLEWVKSHRINPS